MLLSIAAITTSNQNTKSVQNNKTPKTRISSKIKTRVTTSTARSSITAVPKKSTTRRSTTSSTTVTTAATKRTESTATTTTAKPTDSTEIAGYTRDEWAIAMSNYIAVKSAEAAIAALKTAAALSLTTTTTVSKATPTTESAVVTVGKEDFTPEAIFAALGFWGAGMTVGAATSAALVAGNTAAAAVLQAAETNGTSRDELEEESDKEDTDENDEEDENDEQSKFIN